VTKSNYDLPFNNFDLITEGT